MVSTDPSSVKYSANSVPTSTETNINLEATKSFSLFVSEKQRLKRKKIISTVHQRRDIYEITK